MFSLRKKESDLIGYREIPVGMLCYNVSFRKMNLLGKVEETEAKVL